MRIDKEEFNQLISILKEIKHQELIISKKLNILIAPLFKRKNKKQDKKLTQDNIKKLAKCGLDYKEISIILEMSPGTIANELSTLRKNKIIKKRNAKKA